MKQPVKKATAAQIVKINQLLEERIVPFGDGFVKYSHGSDYEIADEIGVSINIVSRIRQKLFGRLRSARTPQTASLEQRVAELEKEVLALKTFVNNY